LPFETSSFHRHPRLDFYHRTPRTMKLILDSFYSDPDSLRELALALHFTARHRNFPGLRSTRAVIPEEVRKAFVSMLGISGAALDNEIPYNGCFQLMRSS